MIKIYCPFCKDTFEADEWESGNCPKCNEEYYFYERCTEDYSDCWTEVEWNWDKLKGTNDEKTST